MTRPVLDFHGKFFAFDNVPMEIKPLQQPHPPIWYGVHAPESAERAAKRNLHVVDLDPTGPTRIAMERYRATWRPSHPGAAMPKLGLGRFVVVADTDAAALRLARRAYPVWHRSFTHLFRLLNRSLQNHPRPADFDTLSEHGQGIAGSPATVRDFFASQLAETGCTYVVGQFAFGDLTLQECLHSIGLFASDVMPALRAKPAPTFPSPLWGGVRGGVVRRRSNVDASTFACRPTLPSPQACTRARASAARVGRVTSPASPSDAPSPWCAARLVAPGSICESLRRT